MQEIKQLKETKPFKANGHDYYFNFDLAISRFKEFQKVKTLLQFAVKEESELFNDFKAIFENVNGNELDRMKILSICQNNMYGIKETVDSQYHGIFQMAALFINRADEDVTKFDKGFNDLKISDWEKEGFSAASFFFLVPSLMSNFTRSLKYASPDSLEKTTKNLKELKNQLSTKVKLQK